MEREKTRQREVIEERGEKKTLHMFSQAARRTRNVKTHAAFKSKRKKGESLSLFEPIQPND